MQRIIGEKIKGGQWQYNLVEGMYPGRIIRYGMTFNEAVIEATNRKLRNAIVMLAFADPKSKISLKGAKR